MNFAPEAYRNDSWHIAGAVENSCRSHTGEAEARAVQWCRPAYGVFYIELLSTKLSAQRNAAIAFTIAA
jgi:hypothetical protein